MWLAVALHATAPLAVQAQPAGKVWRIEYLSNGNLTHTRRRHLPVATRALLALALAVPQRSGAEMSGPGAASEATVAGPANVAATTGFGSR